jgi:hypothetical protein
MQVEIVGSCKHNPSNTVELLRNTPGNGKAFVYCRKPNHEDVKGFRAITKDQIFKYASNTIKYFRATGGQGTIPSRIFVKVEEDNTITVHRGGCKVTERSNTPLPSTIDKDIRRLELQLQILKCQKELNEII